MHNTVYAVQYVQISCTTQYILYSMYRSHVQHSTHCTVCTDPTLSLTSQIKVKKWYQTLYQTEKRDRGQNSKINYMLGYTYLVHAHSTQKTFIIHRNIMNIITYGTDTYVVHTVHKIHSLYTEHTYTYGTYVHYTQCVHTAQIVHTVHTVHTAYTAHTVHTVHRVHTVHAVHAVHTVHSFIVPNTYTW